MFRRGGRTDTLAWISHYSEDYYGPYHSRKLRYMTHTKPWFIKKKGNWELGESCWQWKKFTKVIHFSVNRHSPLLLLQHTNYDVKSDNTNQCPFCQFEGGGSLYHTIAVYRTEFGLSFFINPSQFSTDN